MWVIDRWRSTLWHQGSVQLDSQGRGEAFQSEKHPVYPSVSLSHLGVPQGPIGGPLYLYLITPGWPRLICDRDTTQPLSPTYLSAQPLHRLPGNAACQQLYLTLKSQMGDSWSCCFSVTYGIKLLVISPQVKCCLNFKKLVFRVSRCFRVNNCPFNSYSIHHQVFSLAARLFLTEKQGWERWSWS